MRLELTRSCDHYPLKVACIPISPPAREHFFVPRTGLEPAHLAACAPETHASTNSAIWAKKKSGKRDSNSRPRPWQGRALPTELLPQTTKPFVRTPFGLLSNFSPKADAKVQQIFQLSKYSASLYPILPVFMHALLFPLYKQPLSMSSFTSNALSFTCLYISSTIIKNCQQFFFRVIRRIRTE